MPEDILVAKTWQRCIAFTINLFILMLPLTVAIWLLFQVGFYPEEFIGWIAMLLLLLIVVAWWFITSRMLSTSGQTLGKKILGLRVVVAETGKPAKFSASLLRSLSFVLGLLGFGILPLMGSFARSRGEADEDTWPGNIGGTTVLDIRNGEDPLNPSALPTVDSPASLIADKNLTLAPLTPFLLPVTKLTSTSESEKPSFSSAQQENLPAKTSPYLKPILLQSGIAVLASVLVGILCMGVVFGTETIQNTFKASADGLTFSAPLLEKQKITLAANNAPGLPGYSQGPSWSRPVTERAQVSVSANNVFILDDRTLNILEANSGNPITDVPIDAGTSLFTVINVGDEEGAVWVIGQEIFAWLPSIGTGTPLRFPVPEGAKFSAAGNNLLIRDPAAGEKGPVYTLTKTGVIPLTVPQGRIPLAVDNGRLISVQFSGSLTISSPDGTDSQEIPAQAPTEGLKVMRWVTAGRGIFVMLWSALPESGDPNNPVTIATYSQSTGELLSRMEVPRSRIDEDKEWVRGEGFQLAGFGNYTYDMKTGKPILDIKATGIKRNNIILDAVIGQDPTKGLVYLRGDKAWTISNVLPVGGDNSGMIIRTKDQQIQRFAQD